MKISNIEIHNFRNYEKLKLDFNDNINIFIGNNGEGKKIDYLAMSEIISNFTADNMFKP